MTTSSNRAPKVVAIAPQPKAGQRLVAELAEPNDPYSITFLIEQAGQIADYLERLNALLNGSRDSWLDVRIGAKTVEVIVNSPLREARQMTEQLRRLLGTIYAQRAAIPMGPSDNDDLAGLD
jgi:hypothetical protein